MPYYFSKKKEEKKGESRARCPLKKIQSTWSSRRWKVSEDRDISFVQELFELGVPFSRCKEEESRARGSALIPSLV